MSESDQSPAPVDLYDRVCDVADGIKSHLNVDSIDIVCVLGSGLGGAVDALENRRSVATSEFPHLPQSTVQGHSGVLHHGIIGGKSVLMLQGRVHTYEGVPPWQSTIIIRAARSLNGRIAILTNSAGSCNPAFQPGELMVMADHINLSGRNPLIGNHDERFGPRFPDMTNAYTPEIRQAAHAAAQRLNMTLHEGVYAWNLGPSYETPAEIRMAQTIGVDAVGMSTAPEAIVARQSGMNILGLTCISNLAAGLSSTPLTHEEVQAVAAPAARNLATLLVEVIPHVC